MKQKQIKAMLENIRQQATIIMSNAITIANSEANPTDDESDDIKLAIEILNLFRKREEGKLWD